MGDFLGIYRHLGLFEAHHVVIRWPRDTSSFFVSGLNAWTVVVFVHEECLGAVDVASHVGTTPTRLASYFVV